MWDDTVVAWFNAISPDKPGGTEVNHETFRIADICGLYSYAGPPVHTAELLPPHFMLGESLA
jgi:hypothetical protein